MKKSLKNITPEEHKRTHGGDEEILLPNWASCKPPQLTCPEYTILMYTFYEASGNKMYTCDRTLEYIRDEMNMSIKEIQKCLDSLVLKKFIFEIPRDIFGTSPVSYRPNTSIKEPNTA